MRDGHQNHHVADTPAFVFLVRHGESSGGLGDPGLSERGRLQAHRTGQHLAEERPSAVFSSPLRRATETAKIVAAHRRLEVRPDLRLRERSNWGDRPGQSRDEFIEEWHAASADRDLVLPAGRSARATGDQVLEFCRTQPSGARIVAVTHGGAIGDCLLNLMPIEAVTARHTAFPDMEPCSITILRVEGVGVFAELVASSGHLSGI